MSILYCEEIHIRYDRMFNNIINSIYSIKFKIYNQIYAML